MTLTEHQHEDVVLSLVEAIAEASGLDPMDFPMNLYEVIDLDALIGVLEHGTPSTPISVTFPYGDWEVVATKADDFTVEITDIYPVNATKN